MFGQGRPIFLREDRALRTQPPIWMVWLAIACAVLGLPTAVAVAQSEADRDSLNLRFEWGSGARTQWSGTIAINGSSFADLRPLGMEADVPGSIWIEAGKIHIQQRSARTYDGVDARVTASSGATISIVFQPLGGAPLEAVEISLASLVDEVHRSPLDQQDNQLVVWRVPGDRLHVDFERDTLIFEPGERFLFTVNAHKTGAPPASDLRVRAELVPARGGKSLWSNDYTLRVPDDGGQPAPLPLDVPLPEAEGVYDLRLTATRRTWLRGQFLWGKPLARRTVQVVVLARSGERAPTAEREWQQVLEIDPANPRWWSRLPRWMKLDRLPGMPQGPLGSGHAQTWQLPQAKMIRPKMIRLGPRTDSTEPSWQAYPLPIKNPGVPHMLEIAYPGDVPQHLGIHIVEPNAACVVSPLAVDSGVYLPRSVSDRDATVKYHRLVFWPKTEAPLLLLSNRLDSAPAIFEKIRVLSGPARLPSSVARLHSVTRLDNNAFSSHREERLVAAYLDRPQIPEAFTASDVLDLGSGQTVDDWQSFYVGASRLVDYLHFSGYNGLMMSVMADGSTIYPSRLLEPTPRYDSGCLSTDGKDPLRKDVLELLLRLFDREDLRFTPALHFASPLPELEAVSRRSDPRESGIQWVGADGATWHDRNMPRAGQAPYYNVLHPRVQEAMLSVVDELIRRYGHHRSFHGLAIQMSGMSYAQLPGPQWGFDDHTVAQFERDTKLQVPGDGPDRFAQRAQFLTGPHRDAWLAWRAEELVAFHLRLAERLSATKAVGPLILATANMFDTPAFGHRLRPMLPRRAKIDQLMLELGLQPQRYANHANVIVLRPRQMVLDRPVAEQSVDREANRLIDFDETLPTSVGSASLFYHPSQRTQLPSFDRVNPFGTASETVITSQPTPSDSLNRRRFVHELALFDSRMLFDGGHLLPRGQEDALGGLLNVYRQLPTTGYEVETTEEQPVTIRTLRGAGNAVVYVVNDSPWPVEIALDVEAPAGCMITRLGENEHPLPLTTVGGRHGTWNVALKPFDLAAARFSHRNVRLRSTKPVVPSEVPGQLDEQIRELRARIASLGQLPPLGVLRNADFEAPAGDRGVPGWEIGVQPWEDLVIDAQLAVDRKVFHHDPNQGFSGKQSMRITNRGASVVVRSDFFPTPKSGRLTISVRLRAEDPEKDATLRMGVEGPDDVHWIPPVATLGGPGTRPLPEDWAWYHFPVDDLAVDGPDQIRVHFEVLGSATVWIDDLQLFDRSFSDNEKTELSKIGFSARVAWEKGDWRDCRRLLDSYWPQFLFEYVPPIEEPIARAPARPKPAPDKKEKESMLDRIRVWIPRF